MRASLKTYRRLVVAGFRMRSAYPLATLAGLVANVTFGFLKAAILLATVRAAGGHVGGYDVGTMSAYVWLSQGLLGLVNLYGGHELGERIRTGDIAVDFVRPVDVQTGYLATFMGAQGFSLLPRGVPSVLVGALAVGMTMPHSVWPYAVGLVSVILGMAVSFGCVYAIHGRVSGWSRPVGCSCSTWSSAASSPACSCRSPCSRGGCTRSRTSRRSRQ